jgi:hypothetical protein
MVMVDATGTIVLVNQEVERLFGYTRDELLGKAIDILVPADTREEHPSFRRASFADPSARKMGSGRELFGLHKDGRRIPIEIGLNPIETDEGLFVLSSIVDISARRRAEEERTKLEEQLRQAQKMEAVGRLAGGVAHDFNNILGMIIGYTELARDEVTSTAIAKDLDEALHAARRGKEIVDRILRFSRRQELELKPIDLGNAVEEATALLRATLPAAIEIQSSIPAHLPRVPADATSVHQVILNLVTNAAHAMPRGGRVQIAIESFYVRDHFARSHPTLSEGIHLKLSVQDHGVGMDETTSALALEPFFTTKSAGDGSGLGLSIVHGIIQDHHGAMWIDSVLGQGTTVHCVLPIAGNVDIEASAGPAPDRGHGERVLLVDDEPALARVGARRIEKLGYEATSHTDPITALEALRAAPDDFDLLITDLSMPRLNGMDLARAASAIRPQLPILLLTGFMEDLTPELLAEAGVTEALLKPLDQHELAAAMQRVLTAKQRSS